MSKIKDFLRNAQRWSSITVLYKRRLRVSLYVSLMLEINSSTSMIDRERYFTYSPSKVILRKSKKNEKYNFVSVLCGVFCKTIKIRCGDLGVCYFCGRNKVVKIHGFLLRFRHFPWTSAFIFWFVIMYDLVNIDWFILVFQKKRQLCSDFVQILFKY